MRSDEARAQPGLLPPSDVTRIRRSLLRWGRSHYKQYPWRSAEHSWHALIAEVLLQRTRAESVVPVYSAFVDRYREVGSLHDATEESIGEIMYPLGLRWRVPLVTSLCRDISDRRGSVPSDYGELLQLPGVGPYVASAFLSLHCGRYAVIVDANVVRFICRLTGAQMDGETRRKRWLLDIAEQLTPRRNTRTFNYALLDFTMEVCTRKPDCGRCPLAARLCKHRAPVPANHAEGQ